MANGIHRLVLALTLSGLAGGVMAQSGADSGSAGNSSPPPDGQHPHAWQDRDHGAEGKWGGGPDGDHDWGHGWHHHHHHHHGHWGRGGRGGGWHGRGHGPGLMLNLRELDLTTAQRDQVHTILSAHWESMKNRAKGSTDMTALANPGDPGYAAAVQAAKKRAADRIQEGSDLQMKVYNVLTPQQKSQLTKMLAERKAKMAQWQAERAKGPHGGPSNPQ